MATNKMKQLIESLMDDPELKHIFDDPVVFSRAVCDINPRFYQRKMLRDPSIKKIARLGRRSGKTLTMVIDMLYRAFTQPDDQKERLLVVGPYGIQVETIFDELRRIIQESSILQASLTRSVQSPQRLEFGNGSMILGLSAGSGSGKGGSSIRGQGATKIYLDETDFLTEADINSIMGMQLEDMENIGIWCASTPTGQRKKFWEWCTYASKTYSITDKDKWLSTKDVDKCEEVSIRDDDLANGWTQYHYPSWVSPNWSDEMEAELKSMFSAQGYIHEVEAEFGDATTGVYNKEMIDKSKYNYTYKEMKNRDEMPDTVRIIGVDWDKFGASTQIVVSEYDQNERKIRVVDRVEIPSTEFTFDNAVAKIVELYEYWQPQNIYLDRGYGEYQVETLKKKIGSDIVKGWAFNQKIEVRDPVDNTINKKEVKHFMITQAQILLERGQIMLSSNDELLYKQMENYQVVRRTTSGKPVYTSENEHSHDAFVLTILAFNQEYPDITKLLKKNRKATVMKKVKKRLQDVKEKITFNNLRKSNSKTEEEKELEKEPDYVRHMKSLKFGPVDGATNNMAPRGRNSKPMDRGKI